MNPLGAHELMEVHEVLTNTIDGINQFQLYQPHCKDPELQNILQNQIIFMTNEYNSIVQIVRNKSSQQNFSTYRPLKNASPSFGASGGTPEAPNSSINEMNDHDVASGMLGCLKASAALRMHAALECSDPELRNVVLQGAKNCAEQAYEVWQYMNQKGYYQVPVFQQNTAQAIINHYQPAGNQMNNQQT
ncbi:spore coat protein [Aeribacillus sp. FSL M8-0254]|uniref:spore coat protein n=1 Tax=Aeribacillus sp. FSL M8-0254 TaxID=2954577 RepID=UPI0030F740AA